MVSCDGGSPTCRESAVRATYRRPWGAGALSQPRPRAPSPAQPGMAPKSQGASGLRAPIPGLSRDHVPAPAQRKSLSSSCPLSHGPSHPALRSRSQSNALRIRCHFWAPCPPVSKVGALCPAWGWGGCCAPALLPQHLPGPVAPPFPLIKASTAPPPSRAKPFPIYISDKDPVKHEWGLELNPRRHREPSETLNRNKDDGRFSGSGESPGMDGVAQPDLAGGQGWGSLQGWRVAAQRGTCLAQGYTGTWPSSWPWDGSRARLP